MLLLGNICSHVIVNLWELVFKIMLTWGWSLVIFGPNFHEVFLGKYNIQIHCFKDKKKHLSSILHNFVLCLGTRAILKIEIIPYNANWLDHGSFFIKKNAFHVQKIFANKLTFKRQTQEFLTTKPACQKILF